MKLAAPQSKYIEHLLMATQVHSLSWDGKLTRKKQVGAVDQVFRPLSFRLKDSTWTVIPLSLLSFTVDCLQKSNSRTHHDP